MTNSSTSAELKWAEDERSYRREKRAANFVLLRSFALILFLLILAVSTGTLLANLYR
jgi:hypothetical protein